MVFASAALFLIEAERNALATDRLAAGGSTDTMGRVIAKVMKEQTGWNIIAENKTGGVNVNVYRNAKMLPRCGYWHGRQHAHFGKFEPTARENTLQY